MLCTDPLLTLCSVSLCAVLTLCCAQSVLCSLCAHTLLTVFYLTCYLACWLTEHPYLSTTPPTVGPLGDGNGGSIRPAMLRDDEHCERAPCLLTPLPSCSLRAPCTHAPYSQHAPYVLLPVRLLHALCMLHSQSLNTTCTHLAKREATHWCCELSFPHSSPCALPRSFATLSPPRVHAGPRSVDSAVQQHVR